MSDAVCPLKDFDYPFPEELIAEAPASPRDSSRLLVADRAGGALRHGTFRDLPDFLRAGDCLVLNRSKVLPARLLGRKETGGKVDLLLVRELEPGFWAALSSGLKAGMRLNFPGGATALVEGLSSEGEYLCRFDRAAMADYLRENGLAPLPPYILKKRNGSLAAPALLDDRGLYQTVYARDEGSIAAPTAGLHFTPELLERLAASGVRVAFVTLHVGRGTFRPIECEDAAGHRMLPESYLLEKPEADKILLAQGEGRRVLAVGTTATRALESLALRPEGFGPGLDSTDLFIRPGHQFRVATGLLTNFHLPKSTPLLLAASFLGRERLLAAYQEAIGLRYRLYSFGDAMLIL